MVQSSGVTAATLRNRLDTEVSRAGSLLASVRSVSLAAAYEDMKLKMLDTNSTGSMSNGDGSEVICVIRRDEGCVRRRISLVDTDASQYVILRRTYAVRRLNRRP